MKGVFIRFRIQSFSLESTFKLQYIFQKYSVPLHGTITYLCFWSLFKIVATHNLCLLDICKVFPSISTNFNSKHHSWMKFFDKILFKTKFMIVRKILNFSYNHMKSNEFWNEIRIFKVFFWKEMVHIFNNSTHLHKS